MHANIEGAVRDAVAIAVPPVPLAAIRRRERAIDARRRNRRGTFALAALVLSFAALAFAASRQPSTASALAPVPLASVRPSPTVT